MSTAYEEFHNDLDKALAMAPTSNLRAQLAMYFACFENDYMFVTGQTNCIEHNIIQRKCRKIITGDPMIKNNYVL